MRPTLLKLFVFSVVLAAAGTLLVFPADGLMDQPLTLGLLVLLGVAAGWRPVRFTGMGSALTATHPITLCTLAVLGVFPAMLVAAAGFASALVSRRGPCRPLQTVFNLGGLICSTAAAWDAFTVLGGRVGGDIGSLFSPLLAATTAYYVVNTGLIALAISIHRGRSLTESWRDSFRWTASAYFTGFTVAVAMLTGLAHLGPIGLALAVPPIWLISGFYREHRSRLSEQQRRIDEVEQLNDELRERVEDLGAALGHVQQLQGLLPICMHCKSVRDDKDTWHRIETYIGEHSDLQFTHSLCQECRATHYPPRTPRPDKAGAAT